SDKSKQQNDLLTSILNDTDDIDQIEYFDDDEIYSKTTITSTENGDQDKDIASGNVANSRNSEGVAMELLRMLSIKSANTWWRWNSKDSAVDPTSACIKDSANQSDLVFGDSKNTDDCLIEIEMEPIGSSSSHLKQAVDIDNDIS